MQWLCNWILNQKAKLPSIHKQDKNDVDLSFNNGYKKYKKNFAHPSKKKTSDQSTKVENGFSFSVQNRPAKIHSNADRLYKPEIAVADPMDSQLEMPSEFFKLKEEAAKLDLAMGSRK